MADYYMSQRPRQLRAVGSARTVSRRKPWAEVIGGCLGAAVAYLFMALVSLAVTVGTIRAVVWAVIKVLRATGVLN